MFDFRASWLGYPFVRRVIVSTKDGKDFRGILWDRHGDYLVLRDAELLQGQGRNTIQTRIDGELAVPRENVAYIQVLGGATAS